MTGRADDDHAGDYSRRDVIAAMAKYAAAVGGTAATVVTADGLVSAASAYWSAEKLETFCQKNPTHWRCTGGGKPGNGGGNNQRVQF